MGRRDDLIGGKHRVIRPHSATETLIWSGMLCLTLAGCLHTEMVRYPADPPGEESRLGDQAGPAATDEPGNSSLATEPPPSPATHAPSLLHSASQAVQACRRSAAEFSTQLLPVDQRLFASHAPGHSTLADQSADTVASTILPVSGIAEGETAQIDLLLPAVPSDGLTPGTSTTFEPVMSDAVKKMAQQEPQPAIDSAQYGLQDPSQAMLVQFHDVLQTASGQNPQINFARERIRESFAQLEQAELLWLPSLRAGMNYHYHDGKVLNARGEVLDVSRNSLYAGMASRVVGGGAVGVPGIWMQFHLADAVYQPRVVEQTTFARKSAANVMRNDTLLDVSLAYLRLLQRVQEQAIAVETLENATQLAYLCKDYAEVGLSPPSDADRVFTERALRENAVKRATAEIEVASTELARLLSGDPTVLLLPQEETVVPIELVQPSTHVKDLVAVGLSNRPELRENRAMVNEAIERLNREKYSVLMPSVVMGMSYGAMGGGQGSYMGDFGDRVDFDVALWWEVRQLGLGERALRNENRSRIEQARWRQVQIMDQVAQEVSQAYVQSRARKSQVEIAKEGLEFAVESHTRNIDRIRQGEGLPIEALQSVQALDASRRDYLRAVIEYDEAQFRLYRAMGWPIEHCRVDAPNAPQASPTEASEEIELPLPLSQPAFIAP